MKMTVRVEGLKELQQALLELPKATGRNVVRRALRNAGEPMANTMKARVPVEEGHLKNSIGVGTKLTRRQKSLHKKKSEVELFVGAGADPAAHLVEFGSVHNSPEPFVRPAWDSGKGGALERIRGELANEIEKARARLARKAARLAAKAAAKG